MNIYLIERAPSLFPEYWIFFRTRHARIQLFFSVCSEIPAENISKQIKIPKQGEFDKSLKVGGVGVGGQVFQEGSCSGV